ncbi:threonine ammonia-lyase [Parasedimentitalea psychrophila]|uniref:Threonine/serine dehydratase n=1 Tax=Parasedimentitalea psychrophila TaxID=2997337 RepID=A0A9Y2L1C6_9RHOB|nr:threonine/serine dehydratase [Parasedimentitalea psychrophila]WIY26155.1 threonine/serine dehydratase [Parasedimentitalea psychrophila]
MTSLAMINAAAKRLKGHARVTPLLSSPFLDDLAKRRILVKAECLQHTGSFKFRGGWSALSALDKSARAKGVIAYSSGNHAQGVAHAATLHGVPSVIVMPSDAPQLKIENTRALGAEVILYDRASEDRDAIGLALASERDLTLIKPFDEPQVIAGQGTVGLEIAAQAAELGVTSGEVLVNCGGGGLTSGIALALEAQAPQMQVRTCEPDGFDDAARSLISGNIERNSRSSGSICDAILTPSPGEITFPIMKRLCGGGLVVSEDEALHAMALAFLRLKIVLEPGGAISLAAALFHGDELTSEVAIVVATGGNVDPVIFTEALRRFT